MFSPGNNGTSCLNALIYVYSSPLPNSLAIPVVSDEFSYPEFVIMGKGDTIGDVIFVLENSRNWFIMDYRGEHNSEISSECLVDEFIKTNTALRIQFGCYDRLLTDKWSQHLLVTIKMKDNADDESSQMNTNFINQFKMLVTSKSKILKTKTSIIGFLKAVYASKVCSNFSNGTVDETIVTNCLSKFLMTTRSLLRMHHNADKHLTQHSEVLLEYPCNSKLEFIYKRQNDEDFYQFCFNCMCGRPLLLRNISNQNQILTMICRNEWGSSTVANINTEVSKHLNTTEKVIILDEQGILTIGCINDRAVDGLLYFSVIHLQFSHIEPVQELGKGGYGAVLKFRDKKLHKDWALKRIDMLGVAPGNYKNDIINEILVSTKAESHERIMRYHAFYEISDKTGKFFFICMDVMQMDLSSYVRKNFPLPETEIVRVSRQMLQGVAHLHANGIIHRDIKGANILLDSDNNIKLTDFGLSKYIAQMEKSTENECSMSCCGTYNYMAPELVRGEKGCRTKCDIWSCGATMVEMITGKQPFHDLWKEKIILTLMSERKINYKYPDNYSAALKCLVDSCLTSDYKSRPDCSKLLRLPVFIQ